MVLLIHPKLAMQIQRCVIPTIGKKPIVIPILIITESIKWLKRPTAIIRASFNSMISFY